MIINTAPGSSSGASSVSELSDVTLTNVSDGQVLKYNSNTQKWENANAATYTETPLSGGGTQVTITT